MHSEFKVPTKSLLKAVEHNVSPVAKLTGSLFAPTDRDMKGILTNTALLDKSKGSDRHGMFIQIFGPSKKDSGKPNKNLKLYYLEGKPDEISGIEFDEQSQAGEMKVYVDHKNASGSFKDKNGKVDRWELEFGPTGRITKSEFELSTTQPGMTETIYQPKRLSRHQVQQLKKSGFDPGLITLSTMLQRGVGKKTDSMDTIDKVKILAKTDIALISAAILGVLGIVPEKDPLKLSGMVILAIYGLFYLFNQFDVFKKGLSIPFEEQKKIGLSIATKDPSFLLSTYFQWLTQAI